MWIRLAIGYLLLAILGLQAEIIPVARRSDWTFAGVRGGIPTRSTIYTNLPAGTTLNAINAAIDNCPSNQVVVLSNGSWTLSASINLHKNGVTLRGSGTTNTFLTFTGDGIYGAIHVGCDGGTPDYNGQDPATVINWTAGYSKGSTNLTVATTNGLTPGELIALDQGEDLVNVWALGTEGFCDYCGRSNGIRSQIEFCSIEAIGSGSVTVWPPLHMMNWATTWRPQVWVEAEPVARLCGVEDMSITNTMSDYARYLVAFNGAVDCWIKGCNLYNSLTAAVRGYHSSRIEVRGNYFYGTVNAASQSYGVNPYWSSSWLIVDNIFNKVTGPLNFGSSAIGCVAAYNYCTNGFYTSPTWMICSVHHHSGHSGYNLVEGNHGNGILLDNYHGSGGPYTVLRNRFVGWEPGKTSHTLAVGTWTMNHSNSFVGNLLGYTNVSTFQCVSNNGCCPNDVIWYLGYTNTDCIYPAGADNVVPLSTIRHGNWDHYNDAIVWDAGISEYAIPASYLFASKPSWFGACPWPPFNPSNAVEGAMSPTNIPAGYRFIYGTNPPPANDAPANPSHLRATKLRVGNLTGP